MSCLNIRFPPAKKAWKSFASKLQAKLLHKLRISRAIKKPKSKYNVGTSTALSALDERHKKRRRIVYPSQSHVLPSKHFHFMKKSAPVYIDKLFREPGATGLVTVTEFASRAKTTTVKPIDDQQETSTAVAETSVDVQDGKAGDHEIMADDDKWESLGFAWATGLVTVTEFASREKTTTAKLIDDQQETSTAVTETSVDIQDGKAADHEIMTDDDMWESLGFASPQLQEIDEKAEKFISSFRAELEIQEMIASSSLEQINMHAL